MCVKCLTFSKYIKTLSYSGMFVSVALKTNNPNAEREVLLHNKGNDMYVIYNKLPTNGKKLPAFPLEAVPGIKPQPQRWEARVLQLCHRGPCIFIASHL